MAPSIDTDFFGGSIEIVRLPRRGAIELALRSDSAADIRQWFHFQLADDRPREIVITNAGEATFPNGWDDYQVSVAHGRSWSRASTRYEDGALVIDHRPRAALTSYAYFAPYPERRLARTLSRVNACPWGEVQELGETIEGRGLMLCDLGDDDAELTFWIVARQHPGETPASWLAEGLLCRLCDAEDEAVRDLLTRARVMVVPLANPDGAALGNHRTSASGVNLNRVWDDPDDDAPEVQAMLAAIRAGDVHLFLDVHADEAATFAFASCSEGNPSFSDDIAAAEAALRDDLAELTHEFVDEPFYDLDEPGQADLSCAANQVGESFGCASITLELPIKAAGDERVRAGWSARRAVDFGAGLVDVLLRAAERSE